MSSSSLSEGTIMDHGQLACLCLLARLLQGELEKCLRLVISLPMQDMDKYFGKYKEQRTYHAKAPAKNPRLGGY